MQHSCSMSVNTSIQHVHVMRACIYHASAKSTFPALKKILGTHACAHKHTCTQLRLFPLKIILKKLHGAYAHKHLKKKKKKKKKKNSSFPQKNTWPAFTCRHTRPQHHKYPNNLMLLCFQTQKPKFANMAHMPAITCTITIIITHTHTHTHTHTRARTHR